MQMIEESGSVEKTERCLAEVIRDRLVDKENETIRY